MGRKAAPVPIPDVWSASVGELAQRVTVREEPTRGWRLYLWWRVAGDPSRHKAANWGKASLRTGLRDARGYWLPDHERRKAAATVAAAKKFAQLYGGMPADAPEATAAEAAAAPEPKATALTIGATETAVIDPKKGLYPHATRYRAEVIRAVRYAAQVWGADTEWRAIQRADWLALMRERLQQLVREQHEGVSGTEHTIIRLVTVVRWLNEDGRVTPPIPLPKKDWKDTLAAEWRQLTNARKNPTVHQPRYTLDELRKIMESAWTVDPRFGLLAHLGVGLRLGQVRRSMRSDLATVPTEDGDVLELTVHGAGKKGGAVVELTAGQRAVLERVLTTLYAPLEAAWQEQGTDYPLFPAGRLAGLEHRKPAEERTSRPKVTAPTLSKKMALGRPVSDRWWLKRWREAETAAKVPNVKGRGSYGGRRVVVDAALDQELSDRALQSLGGWTSPNVPKSVYADRESRKGRREARSARAEILGEAASEQPIVGVHSGLTRTTNVPETTSPTTESGTPGSEAREREAND